MCYGVAGLPLGGWKSSLQGHQAACRPAVRAPSPHLLADSVRLLRLRRPDRGARSEGVTLPAMNVIASVSSACARQ